MELKDLLVLLYTAHRRFSSVHVRWQYAYSPEVMSVLHERWATQRPPGSVAMLTATVPTTHSPAAMSTFYRRLWWRKPGCWRDEDRGETGSTMMAILCDGKWWSYSPQWLVTNVLPLEQWSQPGVGDIRQGQPPALAERITDIPLVDPSFLLASHDLEPQATGTHHGREVVQVRATPRPTASYLRDAIFWTAADEYELLVDTQYGILLRYSAKLAGQEFAVASVDHVVFNATIPDDVFIFSPPE